MSFTSPSLRMGEGGLVMTARSPEIPENRGRMYQVIKTAKPMLNIQNLTVALFIKAVW